MFAVRTLVELSLLVLMCGHLVFVSFCLRFVISLVAQTTRKCFIRYLSGRNDSQLDLALSAVIDELVRSGKDQRTILAWKFCRFSDTVFFVNVKLPLPN